MNYFQHNNAENVLINFFKNVEFNDWKQTFGKHWEEKIDKGALLNCFDLEHCANNDVYVYLHFPP